MATHSSVLPGECHGQRSLAGYGPQGHKESDTTEQLRTAHSALFLEVFLFLISQSLQVFMSIHLEKFININTFTFSPT